MMNQIIHRKLIIWTRDYDLGVDNTPELLLIPPDPLIKLTTERKTKHLCKSFKIDKHSHI